MSTYLKPIQVREKLISNQIKIFTPEIFSKLFDSSLISTKHFLETQTKLGLLIRLKRGLYALKTDLPSEEEIANSIYQPSYISFEYALAFHGLLQEMPYIITSATSKTTRNFTINSTEYQYKSINKNIFTGYYLISKDTKSFLIADQEKALLDYLYFVFLKRSPTNDRLITRAKQKIDNNKIERYLKLFNNQKFTKYIKTIL